ncbi:MAG: hypothetical protein WC297_00235 [Candidatus Paceibacterota bacterium]|jgi:hypothetical protein
MANDGSQKRIEGPIKFLINSILCDRQGNVSADNVKLATQLREHGDIAVDLILRELYLCKRSNALKQHIIPNACPAFHLIGVVCILADSRHANQTAQMLLWWETSRDRSIVSSILKTIEKIGDGTTIPILEKYLANLEMTIKPSQSVIAEVKRVIASCQERG